MIFNIFGIHVGVLTLIQSIYMIIEKKERLPMLMIYVVCGLGFIGLGIGGFFIPKNLDYLTVVSLLCFAILYLGITYFSKKRKTAQQHKVASGKK